ncbi:class I SAM-dependent methyltransferase [Mycolicibacterium sphagni]|uniref:class I SAM-dependent methyltransferase n=1 Tax=Mycolicibacterium sphagni TaxID=1786 RepID=UPI0021F2CC32|nr:class I SAM-dependent methyltransferase [Mycolicibacterium sphagni]MCV7176637.1 class I SAM-dependent methyltransferase [Mycolicibacterium sphagni]
MAYMANEVTDIADMPRGGPDASWLDRLLETDCPEYLDRDDVDDEVKRAIVSALDRIGSLFGEHDRNAALVLREVADIVDPTILELGAGHGALSRRLLEQHPTVHVTVSDVNPESVAAMAGSDLGDNPRATVRPVDATAIDAADGSFDLAVFALSFHHLRPAQAARVLAEGARVAGEMLVIDLPRVPSPLHVAKLAALAPLALWWPFAHDGLISSLRSYSPSALRALGAHAGIDVDVSTNPFDRQVVRARRRG